MVLSGYSIMRLLKFSEMARIIARADIVMEIVEARNPLGLKSRVVESLARKYGRDYILVLNKCDLVPPAVCRDWIDYFRHEHKAIALCVSTVKRIGIVRLRKMFLEKQKEKEGILHVAVFGLPKVGKSSLINALKNKDSAPTSPYPGSSGYTKGITVYKILPGIYVIDTPGYIPFDVKGLEVAIRSQPVESIDNPVAVALDILKMIMRFNARAVEEAYNIDAKDPLDVLRLLALKRGWLYKKDKEPNIDEAARAIIRDYLNGKLKFYTLPPTVQGFNP